MIEFQTGGGQIQSNQFSKKLEKALTKVAQEGMRDLIEKKLRGIRDPKTGAKPKITQRGEALSNLSFKISGSESLMKEVTKRLK